MISMSAKQLKIAIKNGYTTDDLAAKYKCTAEDVNQRIAQLYNQSNPKTIQEIHNDLETNRKKSHHRKKAEAVTATSQVVEDEIVSVSISGTEVAPTTPPVKTIEELYAEEKSLSDSLIFLEGEHKKFAEERTVIRRYLETLKEKIDQIESTLRELGEDYEQKMADANNYADEMNNLCTPIREKRAALESLRIEIEKRQTITVYVYEDGRIEAPDNPEFIIDDTGYEELKERLHDREDCQDLRLRDIATLARLLVITRDVDRINLACDTSELEKAYHSISGK